MNFFTIVSVKVTVPIDFLNPVNEKDISYDTLRFLLGLYILSSIHENSPSSQTVPSCDENQPKTTCEDSNIMLSYFIDSFLE